MHVLNTFPGSGVDEDSWTLVGGKSETLKV